MSRINPTSAARVDDRERVAPQTTRHRCDQTRASSSACVARTLFATPFTAMSRTQLKVSDSLENQIHER